MQYGTASQYNRHGGFLVLTVPQTLDLVWLNVKALWTIGSLRWLEHCTTLDPCLFDRSLNPVDILDFKFAKVWIILVFFTFPITFDVCASEIFFVTVNMPSG